MRPYEEAETAPSPRPPAQRTRTDSHNHPHPWGGERFIGVWEGLGMGVAIPAGCQRSGPTYIAKTMQAGMCGVARQPLGVVRIGGYGGAGPCGWQTSEPMGRGAASPHP
jgi:hypothetical protein